ncbi:hypothetical protein TNCT_623771 [Trichonephila clavata]|uniref:Uncharacterized protein n=1 Tax=Trichonephila clavata TaxID=2740835 RepID=A0A8X6HSJ1_TRICU|nr:hypothetical protein TNCT_623771 [Trichonephila clavata]
MQELSLLWRGKQLNPFLNLKKGNESHAGDNINNSKCESFPPGIDIIVSLMKSRLLRAFSEIQSSSVSSSIKALFFLLIHLELVECVFRYDEAVVSPSAFPSLPTEWDNRLHHVILFAHVSEGWMTTLFVLRGEEPFSFGETRCVKTVCALGNVGASLLETE